jgi:hypothetical protein
VIPLSRFRAAAARPRGVRQVDALLSAPDPAAAVGALSVPELFFLVHDVGLGEAGDLVALATPEQIRGCLDLELWDRDRLQDEAVRPWLSALLDIGPDKLGEVWAGLDPELAALLLARWTRIHDLSLGEEVPEESERPIVTTPDTFFALEILADDDADVRQVHQLVDHLYRADMQLARHTLMAARSEPTVELEEMSYRWRSGRLADLGYVDFHEALEVFRPLDPGSIAIGEGTADQVGDVALGDEARVPRSLPAALADPLGGRAFLAATLDRIGEADELERLQAAFAYLVNRVLSASRVAPGDAERVGEGAAYAAATLSLGLETVARGDVDRAAEALRTVSLARLHRAGFTLSLRLARLARALAPRAVTAPDADRELLAALLGPRPLFASPRRPFETTADVRVAATALARLALRIAIAEQALGVDLVDLSARPEPSPELDDFARTAVGRVIAGGEPEAEPLAPDELAKLAAAFVGGALPPAARARAVAALRERLDRTGVTAGREYLDDLVDSWARDLESSVGALPAGAPLDQRFVAGLLLRTDVPTRS